MNYDGEFPPFGLSSSPSTSTWRHHLISGPFEGWWFSEGLEEPMEASGLSTSTTSQTAFLYDTATIINYDSEAEWKFSKRRVRNIEDLMSTNANIFAHNPHFWVFVVEMWQFRRQFGPRFIHIAPSHNFWLICKPKCRPEFFQSVDVNQFLLFESWMNECNSLFKTTKRLMIFFGISYSEQQPSFLHLSSFHSAPSMCTLTHTYKGW